MRRQFCWLGRYATTGAAHLQRRRYMPRVAPPRPMGKPVRFRSRRGIAFLLVYLKSARGRSRARLQICHRCFAAGTSEHAAETAWLDQVPWNCAAIDDSRGSCINALLELSVSAIGAAIQGAFSGLKEKRRRCDFCTPTTLSVAVISARKDRFRRLTVTITHTNPVHLAPQAPFCAQVRSFSSAVAPLGLRSARAYRT